MDLEPGWGEAAIVGDRQVALIRLPAADTAADPDGLVTAVSHRDPATGAHVMARGIVGSREVDGEERPTLASPLHKEVYDLLTGRCYTNEGLALETYPVRVRDGVIEVQV